MNPDISDTQEVPPAANAVSLFGQSGGMNDFPVLKAFQEYIDAEQAKARKRMFGLSIFFIVLLVVVVVTFTIVVMFVINRNQNLSDRLLDIALREKNPAQPVVNVQQPIPTSIVQPVLQHTTGSPELVRLQDALQRQKDELQREKEARQADLAKRDKEKIETLTAALAKAQQPVAPAPVVVTTSPTPVVQPTAESAELIRLRDELRREKEARKAEKDKQEKERQEAEKQAFLRRRYPDYYEKEDARKAAAAAEAARRATPPLPTPEPELTPATNSAELNRQREELRREEEKLRREREEEAKRKAEQAKREEEARRKAEQAKREEEAKRKAEQARREEEARRKAEQAKREEEARRRAELAKREAEKKRAEAEAAKRTAAPLPTPTLKPITYFDETKPSEDPELKELLKRPPAARATPQIAPKPAPQPAAKPAPKPPARPAATQQPVQKTTAQPTHKTETLAIGGAADGSSIPWLIEIPVQQHQ